MNTFVEILLAIAVLSAIPLYYYFLKIHRVKKFLNQFPCPPRKPIVGHILDFKSAEELLPKFHEYARNHGTMVHLQFGPLKHTLLCSDYKFLEWLLTSNTLLKKTAALKYLEPWIGTGLALAEGAKWKLHRKLLTPAFHFKILEQFVDVFESVGSTLVEKLSEESGNKSVDIYPYVTKCTLEAICETAMGTKIDVQKAAFSPYFQSVKDMCSIFLVRTTNLFLQFDFFFRFSKYYGMQKQAVKILHSYTNGVIRGKREELSKKDTSHTSMSDEFGRKKKKAFLDLILEAKVDNQSLSEEEIREETDTFMFGGHDTTAAATTFILFCIANNKHVQDRIIEEQQKFFGSEKNPKVTYADLQEMKYLENVVKEGLRLYSPVPVFGRLIDQDSEYNGMVVPKNLEVIIFTHGMHMNPEFFPNPEKFDPDRFENMVNKHPFIYLPFSAGPRNCMGQKYALLEIKSLVSQVVRNIELFPASPKHEMDLAPEVVLKSLNGVKVGLKSRV